MSTAAVPMGRRERKKQAVREKIFEESLELIEQYGVEGTTIDAICDCADIAKKTFYNYYGSKHDLLLDICQQNLLDRSQHLIADALQQYPTLADQLDFIFQVMTDRNKNAGRLERELIDYLVANLSDNRSQGASQLTFMNNSFKTLYAERQAELQEGLSPAFCAEMTVGMLNALMLNWLHNDDYDAQRNYADLCTFIKRSMLR